MPKTVEIKIGDRFNKLVVLGEVERWIYPSGDTRRQFLMQCDCGSEPRKFLMSNFKTGSTKSCGCYNKEKNTSHGMYATRQYRCWVDMKTRCDSSTNQFFSYYGGRGITYCEKWKAFDGFWEDMAEGYSDDLTINRRDNDGPYCKENCSWDTKSFQGHMRRKLRNTLYSVIGATESCTGQINAGIKYMDYKIHLGAYDTEQEVAEAYDLAASWFYGDRPNKTVETRPEIAEKVKYYYDNRDIILRPKGDEVWNATLTDQEVLEIWDLLKSGLFFQRELCELYYVKQSVISTIKRGSSWTHLTNALRVERVKLPFNIHNVTRLVNGDHAYWFVSRAEKNKPVVRKTFSVTKLGEEGAREAAMRERGSWIKSLEDQAATMETHV